MLGVINLVVSEYEHILKENKLYFFEEYTDHGIIHVEAVMEASARLVSSQTYRHFLPASSESIGIYILATILHDIGMHINPESFYALISGVNDDIRNIRLDEKTWAQLWNDYLDEARRFGDFEKKNILGNLSWEFEAPQIDCKDKLTGEDKKLIGEFIRRHHPRIAHEIAIKGFPSINHPVPFASGLDIELKDICGLVARSHGVNIRSLFGYLQFKFEDTWMRPHNIEVFYLMVLLRVADYFQVDSKRTPEITVKLKTFNSPISQIEHSKHLAVKYVQPHYKDPETLIFHCSPQNSLIFIRLQELFRDIQKELDSSWAILGEIYGRDPEARQPKILYRRLKSNLDDTARFSEKVNYIPDSIKFKVSSQVPKLLIGPLYGNDPSYGVRELLQNALDTCRERELLQETGYGGDIFIRFFEKDKAFYFQIEDNGMGMSLHIIKNYFLEVGSSLRTSPLWKKAFMDGDGKSQVQRTGKFGIGVLAGFLLGDSLTVETRHLNSNEGLRFSTDLSNDQIEITKTAIVKIGTTITIEVKEEIFEKLQKSKHHIDEWYLQNKPRVTFEDQIGRMQFRVPSRLIPNYDDSSDKEWRELKVHGYNKILWKYQFSEFFSSGHNFSILVNNGILIPGAYSSLRNPELNNLVRNDIDSRLPSIAVFDFEGKLPLTLNRDNLDGGILPFKEELVNEIFKDIIARLLTWNVESPINGDTVVVNKFSHPAIPDCEILFSKEGFIINHQLFILKNHTRPLLELSLKSEYKSLEKIEVNDGFIRIRHSRHLAWYDYQTEADIQNYDSGAKLYLPRMIFEKLFSPSSNRYPQKVTGNYQILNSNENFVELSHIYNSDSFSLVDVEQNLARCNFIVESGLIDFRSLFNFDSTGVFEKLMIEYFSAVKVIPYDFEVRKVKLKDAFDKLNYYIQKYI